MQWLIDIVKKWVWVRGNLPPCYEINPDFPGLFEPPGSWLDDGDFHEADVSAVVPANATAINVAWRFRANVANGVIYVKPTWSIAVANTCVARTQVADIDNNANLTIGLDANKKFKYRLTAGLVWSIAFRIRGWCF